MPRRRNRNPLMRIVSSICSLSCGGDANLPRPARVVQSARARRYSLSKIILLLYLAVAGIFLIRLACGLIAALRLWRRAKPISGELLTASHAPVDLRCSTEVLSPVTICSAIVLPADYATWDSEKLRVVLAHERSHIRQKDFYLQLLAGVYAAVVWFSPLGWWLKRKLSDLAEAISDRAGLEEAPDRTSYAQILLEFAAAPRPTLIGVAMARSGSLSRRIERLLNDVSFRQAFAGSRRALAAVLVVPVVLFAATALVRVQAAGQQAPPEPPAPAVAPQAGVPAAPAPAAVAPAAARRAACRSPHRSPVSLRRLLLQVQPYRPRRRSAGSCWPAPRSPAPPAPAVTPRAPVDGPAVLTIAPPQPPRRRADCVDSHAPEAAVLFQSAERCSLVDSRRATLANGTAPRCREHRDGDPCGNEGYGVGADMGWGKAQLRAEPRTIATTASIRGTTIRIRRMGNRTQ